jgi:hypothetical protein
MADSPLMKPLYMTVRGREEGRSGTCPTGVRMGKVVVLIVIWAVVLGAEAPPGESYALYSSIYKNTQALEADEAVGIAENALAIPFLECVKPATQEEREMLEGARAAREQHVMWQARFDIGRAYTLIPATETDKAINCVQGHAQAKGCESYVKMRYIRFFSVPVFNRDHTRALIAIYRGCGGLCGEGSLRVYRKTSAGWEREPDTFAKCVWWA